MLSQSITNLIIILMNTDSQCCTLPQRPLNSTMHCTQTYNSDTKLPKLLSNFSTFIALLYTSVINYCISLSPLPISSVFLTGPVNLHRQSTRSPLQGAKRWHCCLTRCKSPWPECTTVRHRTPSRNNWRRPFWSKLTVSLLTKFSVLGAGSDRNIGRPTIWENCNEL